MKKGKKRKERKWPKLIYFQEERGPFPASPHATRRLPPDLSFLSASQIINFDLNDDEAHDPLATTFPRVTQCSFKKFGASGTIETRESLCILPQNILNEKVFILMWFWFVILATITAMHVSCVDLGNWNDNDGDICNMESRFIN